MLQLPSFSELCATWPLYYVLTGACTYRILQENNVKETSSIIQIEPLALISSIEDFLWKHVCLNGDASTGRRYAAPKLPCSEYARFPLLCVPSPPRSPSSLPLLYPTLFAFAHFTHHWQPVS